MQEVLLQLPPKPVACRALKMPDAERLSDGRWPDSAHCLTCQGAGTFRWYAPDSSEIATYACPCREQWMMHRWFSNAGIPLRHQQAQWRDLDTVSHPIRERIAVYLDDHQRNAATGMGMTLWSEVLGTGKTLLQILMAKELMSRGEDLYFTQFTTMIDNFTSGWRDEAERHWFIRRIRNAGVLVVDDMGREGENRSIPMIESMLDELIRHRVADGRPTLLTTNKDAAWFRGRYGGHVVSLLTETNEWVEVTGADYRPRMAERMQREQVLGLSRPVVVG